MAKRPNSHMLKSCGLCVGDAKTEHSGEKEQETEQQSQRGEQERAKSKSQRLREAGKGCITPVEASCRHSCEETARLRSLCFSEGH